LNKLVEKVTSEDQTDTDFQKAFLMTYLLFTTHEQLLRKLIQRYTGSSKATPSSTIQLRVINFIRKWLDDHFYSFSEQHIETLKAFLDQHLKQENSKQFALIQSVLQRKIQTYPSDFSEDRKRSVFKDPPPEPKVDIRTIFSPTLKIADLDELELARQFTLIEFDLFCKIKPNELLNQAWIKPALRHRAPNVLALAQRSTDVSEWISTMIVKEERLRNRAKLFAKFLKIGEHLRKMNNLSTLMALMAGLNNASVYRLRHTRDEISKQNLTLYESLMSSVGSAHGYKSYREIIAAIEPPCIPYIGVYLTDLVYIDEGHQNLIKSPSGAKDLINWQKKKLIYNVISQLQQWQNIGYNIMPIPQIYQMIKSDKIKHQRLVDTELWNLSLQREPRDAERANLIL